MPRTLDAAKALEVVNVVKRLGAGASFRSVWKEVARAGILTHNKTLRAYLDLLVKSGMLSVRTRDVGSVYRQQIYFTKASGPKVLVGVGALQRHGLNWDTPLTGTRPILTDLDGLVRSKTFEADLVASLEDCLVDELHEDAKKNIGTTSLVIAMTTTRKVELPYLLRRADEKRVGKAFRILLRRTLEITSSNHTELDAGIFFAVRDRFLRTVRQYSRTGFWKIVEDEAGVGDLALSLVKRLTEHDVIVPAAKQLGVAG